MSMNFPVSPSLNQTYTYGDRTWKWDGSAWNLQITSVITLPTQNYVRTAAVATAGQTTFTVAYTVGSLQVYLNGVLLNSTDYTATNGTSVVLSTAAALNDLIEFIAYSIVNVGQVAANGVLGGTSGQVLTSDGTAGTWATPAPGFTTGKAIAMAIVFGG